MARGNVLRAALLVSLALMLAEGTNPGIVGRITSKGLDYARREGVAVLQRELPRIKLPDVSESTKFLWGNFYYTVHSMKIDSFRMPNSTITPIPNVGLEIIANAYAELSGEWNWKYWLVQHKGSFTLKMEGISIPVTLKLGRDSAGRPTVATHACSTSVSNIQVHVSGTWMNWFYNLFSSKIGTTIRNTLVDKVCKEVSDSVSSRLQPYLQTLPVIKRIDKVSGIDYSLLGPPIATSDSLDVDLKGEFFSLAHRSAAPFPAPAISFPADQNHMLYFGVSSYLFNTASYVYYRAGALNFEITDNMIPRESQIRLSTSSFGFLVPQIEKLYPNMLMKLKVSPVSPPTLAIAPEGLSLTAALDVQSFAIRHDSSLAPLFVLDVATTISANVAMKSNKVIGSFKVGSVQLSLKHSDVGQFSVQTMQATINFFVAQVLVPQINERLAQGFPLPLLDNLKLSNPVLQSHQNLLLFGTDVNYS